MKSWLRNILFMIFAVGIFLLGGVAMAKDIYDFRAKLIDGKEIPLSDFRGKVVLVVNTASKCGFTPQYASLEKLYERYKDRGFTILAFPSNDFKEQEPGSNEEIRKFCDLRFKVAFPLFEKIDVKGGKIHPLYAYLTRDTGFKGDISWNFNKFLVDPKGNVLARFDSRKDPLSEDVTRLIEEVLPES